MARRKITPEALPEELPELTQQQMRFVEGLLAGKTASDAYRGAYDCSNMLPSSVWCAASKLCADTKVKQWLSAARQAYLGSATVTLEGHLRELERLKEIALTTGNVGAAVQAEQLRGKAAGHYVEQYADLTVSDPEVILRRMHELDPLLAVRMAERFNIPWQPETRH